MTNTMSASLRFSAGLAAATLVALGLLALAPTPVRATCPGETAAPGPAAPSSTPDALRPDLAEGRIVSGIARERVLHFTFDDGPSRSHTPEVLATLERYHVRATFFVVARRLEHEEERALVREIARRGHTVGLHSYAHDDLTEESTAELTAELAGAEALFVSTLGARPWLFRPPYGAHDDHVDTILAGRRYTEVLWNLHGSDVTARTADEVVLSFRAQLDAQRSGREGGVVLLHDTHPWTSAALPRIFEELEARNCEALSAGEDLWDVAPDLSPWVQARHGAPATRRATRMDVDDELWAARQASLREAATASCASEVA